MLRVASAYVGSRAVAEEVVQETWLRVLQSLDRFEGRSSLRTWLFVILANCARRRAEREGRTVAVTDLEPRDAGPSVASDRFFPPSHPRWAGMWTTLVDAWDWLPDERLLAGEVRDKLREAVAQLSERAATVFILRDVEGWPSGDVCEVLSITAENQRVLLHRARTRLRASLEEYLERERR